MLIRTSCPECAGSGVQIIQTSSLWGLRKRETPVTCEACRGSGESRVLPDCEYCDGRGLVGNENEICRACNGTGHIDAFAMIPRDLLQPGTIFGRRCDSCGNSMFILESGIESYKLNRSWEAEECLRQVEIIERVKVHCSSCPHSYFIQVAPGLHKDLDEAQVAQLEDLGLDMSFLNDARRVKQGSLQA
jgi:DnaJ-class molecular chaperone